MCKIAICQKRHLTENEFNDAWSINDDGFGYAYIERGKIIAQKGIMEKNEALKIHKQLKLPHVIHFRLSSYYEKSKELTHPFICENRSRVFEKYAGNTPVLFHNGIIRDWQTIAAVYWAIKKEIPDGKFNDTRLIASIIGEMKLNDAIKYLKNINSGKFVIVHKNGIIRIGEFIKMNGVLASGYIRDEKPITQYFEKYNTASALITRARNDFDRIL
jgi:hypothetical protein